MKRLPLLLATSLVCVLTFCHGSVAAKSRPHQAQPLTVVLDPGHGGRDMGAADVTQTEVEKILSLRVAKQTAHILRGGGYRVYLTRTWDREVNLPRKDVNHDGKINHTDELAARPLFANRHHADVFVSIHFDANADPGLRGTHGYYCPARPFWRKNLRLANLLTNSVVSSLRHSGYSDLNDGVQTDVADLVPQTRKDYPWFLVLGPSLHHYVTATSMPGALIETLYLSSRQDSSALRRPSTIRAISQGYANGIRAFFQGRVRA